MFDDKAQDSEFMDVNRELDFSFEEELENDIDNKENSSELVRTDIEEMLTPSKIKTVLMNEKKNLDEHAVVIDLTNVGMITEESLRALRYLVKEDGDMDIILKVRDNNRGIGKGDSSLLYQLLPQMIEKLYNKEAKLYFKKNNKFVPYDALDTSIIRLKLH